MNDIATLAQMSLVLAATIAPMVILVRILARWDDDAFGPILRSNAALRWPRGVQEEEPQPWRFPSAAA